MTLIDFLENPIELDIPFSPTLSDKMCALCESQVIEIIEKKAIRRTHYVSGVFLSNIFVIPKSFGGFRQICNLKNLNSFLAPVHFKMEGIPILKGILWEGHWFVKVDLKDAYLTVPVGVSHQKLLCFSWRDNIYQF